MIFDHVRLHDEAFNVEPNLPFLTSNTAQYTNNNTHLICCCYTHNSLPHFISPYILLFINFTHTERYSFRVNTTN